MFIFIVIVGLAVLVGLSIGVGVVIGGGGTPGNGVGSPLHDGRCGTGSCASTDRPAGHRRWATLRPGGVVVIERGPPTPERR